ncbi:hypothetical protein ACFQE1_04345 [Halobium palmae]|uniref:Halobacterial output domain-containing protein n=1 Tax=Halobium palmae TaxID=1776492 RepID=A0ABD5RW22_9EURY
MVQEDTGFVVEEDAEEPELPDEISTVIVARASGFQAPPPEGYDTDAAYLNYELGDAIPRNVAAKVLDDHPNSLAPLDEDGELIEDGRRTFHLEVSRAVKIWNSGDGFDPSEYGE